MSDDSLLWLLFGRPTQADMLALDRALFGTSYEKVSFEDGEIVRKRVDPRDVGHSDPWLESGEQPSPPDT